MHTTVLGFLQECWGLNSGPGRLQGNHSQWNHLFTPPPMPVILYTYFSPIVSDFHTHCTPPSLSSCSWPSLPSLGNYLTEAQCSVWSIFLTVAYICNSQYGNFPHLREFSRLLLGLGWPKKQPLLIRVLWSWINTALSRTFYTRGYAAGALCICFLLAGVMFWRLAHAVVLSHSLFLFTVGWNSTEWIFHRCASPVTWWGTANDFQVGILPEKQLL